MSLDLFVAATLFAAVMLFTPGPNNIMLMTSGLNFGFSRTLPHIFGVFLGHGLMLFVVGLGLGTVFQLYPALYTTLKYLGAAYLLYLAWRIGTAGEVKEGKREARPMTFLEAAAFQWVNAKGWIVAIGAITTYAALAPFPVNIIVIAILFTLMGAASSSTWAAFGSGLKRVLKQPSHVRMFNIAMALLLVASIYPVFKDGVW